MTCSFCNEETSEPLLHLAECQFAPEEARIEAKLAESTRAAFAAQPAICCKVRKKVLMQLSAFSESLCGVSDSELADYMTFEKFGGKPVICPKFCPWCGKPWVRKGISVT